MRRVIRVAAHADADLFGNGDDLFEKIDEVPAQAVGVDRAIFRKMRTHVVQRQALGRPRQAEGDVGGKGCLLTVVHRLETTGGLVGDLLGEVG